MRTLVDSDRRLYETAYAGERWIWTTRKDRGVYALALLVAGREDLIEVPTSSCWSNSYRELRSYADFLNTERLARLRVAPAPRTSPSTDSTSHDDDQAVA